MSKARQWIRGNNLRLDPSALDERRVSIEVLPKGGHARSDDCRIKPKLAGSPPKFGEIRPNEAKSSPIRLASPPLIEFINKPTTFGRTGDTFGRTCPKLSEVEPMLTR